MRIGVDIVDIERFKTVVCRTPRLIKRVFTDRELQYCMARSNPYPSLAVRFAAKEAVRKLHPVLSQGLRFHDIEVSRDESGRPAIILHGAALEKAQAMGLINIEVSLSHSREQAIAAVVAGGGEKPE